MPAIRFFAENIHFNLSQKLKLKRWIKNIIKAEGYNLMEINYVFCSDDYLSKINQSYLGHNTFTDIITFDNSDGEENIEGDIYISIDRVKENAERLNISFEDEIHRVIIHGVLHLCGYKDKTREEKRIMKCKEDTSLNQLSRLM